MKCSYCSKDLVQGSGMMYVYNTGIVKYYCSHRCYRNDVVMKRKFHVRELKKKKPAAKK